MLEWLTTEQQNHYAEDSKLVDGPETPAPVFALRAFKSLFQGSPNKQEETWLSSGQAICNDDGKNSVNGRRSGRPRRRSIPETSPSKPVRRPSSEVLTRSFRKPVENDSPMKSILLSSPRKMATPGTKKKNVSFGQALHGTKREKRKADKPDWESDAEETLTIKGTNSRIMRDTKDNGTEKSGGSERMANTSIGLEAPKVDNMEVSKHHTASKEQNRNHDQGFEQSSRSGENVSLTHNKINTEQEQYSIPSALNHQYHNVASSSPEEISDYITRTSCEVRKLVKIIKTTRSFARKKDQEATELSAKLAKRSAQNQRLHAENRELKEKLKAVEEKLTRTQESHSTKCGDDFAISKEAKVEAKADGAGLTKEAETLTTPLPAAHPDGEARELHDPASDLESVVHSPSDVTADARMANVPKRPQLGSIAGTPPMRTSSANARVRLAPDRLAAAKARLRVKSDERKKACEPSPADKENA